MRRELAKNNLIAGLDIGTSKVCVCIGEKKEDSINIRGIGLSRSKGMEKGMVRDVSGVSDSIQAALEAAEEEAGTEIHTAFAGIGGPHMQGYISRGLRLTSSREKRIMREDLFKAFEGARSRPIPLDREVIHLLPQECVVDNEEGIIDPIGMYGEKLEARLYVVTSLVNASQNLTRAINQAGLNVEAFVASSLATGSSVLLPDEKEDGVILVDIGDGTTDIAIFKRDMVRYVYVLPVGGRDLTESISSKFNLPISEAERIKKSSGSISIGSHEEKIPFFRTGQRRCEISKRELCKVLDKSASLLLAQIKRHLENIPSAKEAFCGAVFSGGTSLLGGFLEKAEETLNLPVRIGIARGFLTCMEEHTVKQYQYGKTSDGKESVPGETRFLKDDARLTNPAYAAGLGLLKFNSLEQRDNGISGLKGGGLFHKIRERFRNLMEDYF